MIQLQILGAVATGTESDRSPVFRPAGTPEIEYQPLPNDVRDSISYLGLDGPGDISSLLWLDHFQAGEAIADDVPILFVNQPMFIASGENSDIRYNEAYPQWAYDGYREIMSAQADIYGRAFLDLWDAIPPEYFTDDIFHLTPEGERLMAEALSPNLYEMICGQ
ncbi:MAG: SGNH/GDSL hydrolase family protein [Anaerolineae bacterium]|nr:SGNH/GDSL hydrolase family protein [Anaerolineae bacterium]